MPREYLHPRTLAALPYAGMALEDLGEIGTVVLPIMNLESGGSSMGGICRMVSAAIFLAHMTVGCCAHHAHAVDGGSQSSPIQDSALCDGASCGNSGDQSGHAPHAPQDCQGDACFAVSVSPGVPDSLEDSGQALASVLPCKRPHVARIGSSVHALVLRRMPLPVRLHLANQVLLI
jgi:hypothetical protein